MNTLLFFSLLVALFGSCLYIGRRASAKVASSSDYFLTNRSLGIFPLTMTLLATQVGGGMILGAAEEAYRASWWVLFYPAGACLGLLLLATGLGARFQQANVSTVAELFEKIYGSVTLRKAASLLSIASLFLTLIAQAIGMLKFLVSIGYGGVWVFGAIWLIIVIYTAVGGLRAVVNTDVIQMLFIVASLVLTATVVFFGLPSQEVIATAPAAAVDAMPIPWVSWLMMPLLFMLIEQDMGQCCFAAKSPRSISWATGLAAILLMATACIPIGLGALANQLGLPIAPGSSALMTVVQACTNPSVVAIFGCAVLLAIVSTATSVLCSISSNIAMDFCPAFAPPQRRVITCQLVTFGIGMIALLASFQFNNVVALLMQAYELSICSLVIPIALAFSPLRPSSYAAGGAIVAGAIGFIAFRMIELPIPREIASLGLSLAGFTIGWIVHTIMQRRVVQA